ncbi:MAG: DNA-directed RNA polymerase subunit N [Candidatus Aenigmarchaeota archaeon]|nr:DNA-directed RNA polymerase subunit N [Candidatus Aenigmarchaeota archaeon]
MQIPIRCMSCGRPLSSMWEKYQERVERGGNPTKVLDDLGVKSYCCRTTFLTHKDMLKKVAQFRV